MLGRETEWGRIEGWLDLASDGPVRIELEGSPGIGKTTLWRAAVAEAERRGHRVLQVAPAEPDALLPLSGLADMLEGYGRAALPALPEPQRRAVAAAIALEDASPSFLDPHLVARGVLTLFRDLSEAAPLVLAIDDEQWLDQATAQALEFATRRLHSDRVCLLITRRAPAEARFGGDLPGGRLILGPLNEAATRELVAAEVGHAVRPAVVRRIHAVAGGNPLYVVSIAREIAAGGGLDGELPVPATITAAMARRLAHLDACAEEPVLVVALASGATQALLSAVLPEFRLSDLESAIQGEIIEVEGNRVRFTHPLLAAVHAEHASGPRRRAIHRALAEVVRDEVERGWHLARGGEAPGSELAAAIEHAAGAAASRSDPGAAAELFERAARLTPEAEHEDGAARVIAAARMHNLSGDSVRSRSMLEDVLVTLAPGESRAEALVQLALARTDDFAVVPAILDEALSVAGENDRLLAEIQSLYSGMVSDRGNFNEMRIHARAALTHARNAGELGVIAQATAAEAGAAFFTGQPVDLRALGAAVELEDAASASTYELPSTLLGEILFWSDDLDRARLALEKATRRATERGEEADSALLLLHLALVEWFSGNAAPAEERLAECRAAGGEQTRSVLGSWLPWAESLIAFGRGDPARADELAAEALTAAEQAHDILGMALAEQSLAVVDLINHRADAVHERLAPRRERLIGSGFGFMGSLSLGLWSLDAEALLALGRFDEAETVASDLNARAAASGNLHSEAVAHRVTALVLAARNDAGAALDALESALAAHALRPVRPEIARTLVEKGVVERRARRKGAARRTLTRALAMLEDFPAAPLRARALDELTRVGVRTAAPAGGLTPAQTRVAELVLAGMSNREIAAALYMSTRSVESHLTKLYRALGVRSRAQLAGRLGAGGQLVSDASDVPGD